MWVLALDTTTRDGSVALVRDDDVVIARPGEAAFSHAERLPADLRDLLAAAGLSLADIDLVAVATGPGGFTGLRIGLAAAQGLALALDRPTAGVPSLDALIWDLFEREPDTMVAGAWMEAARGEVFAAAARRPNATDGWPLTPLLRPTAAPPAETLQVWRASLPLATPVATADLGAAAGALSAAGYRAVTPAPLLAATVGRVAVRMHRLGLTGAPSTLTPEYVRRPDVELVRSRTATGAPHE